MSRLVGGRLRVTGLLDDADEARLRLRVLRGSKLVVRKTLSLRRGFFSVQVKLPRVDLARRAQRQA